ncbi:MAG: hypothetical protein FWC67_00435 [Defluviitaleaceae bacterium]|nr:hypothetical protein [Defluviitaleaceae bacterium]
MLFRNSCPCCENIDAEMAKAFADFLFVLQKFEKRENEKTVHALNLDKEVCVRNKAALEMLKRIELEMEEMYGAGFMLI